MSNLDLSRTALLIRVCYYYPLLRRSEGRES